MVQLRTNFCSQQISASFWCNMEQNFLECSRSKFSVVFSETRVNTGQDPLVPLPRRAYHLQSQVHKRAIDLKKPATYNQKSSGNVGFQPELKMQQYQILRDQHINAFFKSSVQTWLFIGNKEAFEAMINMKYVF